jgi:selenide,water dikinase
MGADALAQVLRPLADFFPAGDHPNLLAGLEAPDDAAVWRLADDDALIATADFFPPVVDDPEVYGAIAAANSMSDVFAMGGEVLFALNIAAFPEDLAMDAITAIFRGGAERVRAAGGVVAGGHTVIDEEPKFGLAVVGRADPRRLLRKAGARPGDVLILTKPLGTGLVTTAIKSGNAEAAEVEAVQAAMRALNLVAGRAAVAAGAHAATDITGYGLAGHAAEMAAAGGVALAIELGHVPRLPGADRLAAAGATPGGTERNRRAFAAQVSFAAPSLAGECLAYDPQTSGGLLVALDPRQAPGFTARLEAAGERGWRVGTVEAGSGVRVV